MLFSLLQTLELWELNPRAWLTAYLEACAASGGKVPSNLDAYLPWNLSAEQREQWKLGRALTAGNVGERYPTDTS